MAAPRSAGVLLYRQAGGVAEVLLVLPGGPYWRRRDVGAWQIPKGAIEAGEAPVEAAMRELEEELGVVLDAPPVPLARVKQAGGKWVEAFVAEREVDAAAITSITFELEWPPRSGRLQTYPEVERARWFGLAEARAMMLPSQLPLLDALRDMLAGGAA